MPRWIGQDVEQDGGMAWRIRWDGTQASMLRASGAGAGNSVQTDAASGARMGMRRGAGPGVR
jgi:hypothetical protein